MASALMVVAASAFVVAPQHSVPPPLPAATDMDQVAKVDRICVPMNQRDFAQTLSVTAKNSTFILRKF
ncbi:MAG: hypothetical protein WBA48_15300 [Xanthobacteraceae bacterium]